jgi:hypothetical protein
LLRLYIARSEVQREVPSESGRISAVVSRGTFRLSFGGRLFRSAGNIDVGPEGGPAVSMSCTKVSAITEKAV